jgi:DNA-binding NtrC family response regulator
VALPAEPVRLLERNLLAAREVEPVPVVRVVAVEAPAVLRTLEAVGGSTVRAAAMLGVSVRKIQYRLKEYRTGQHPVRQRLPDAEEGPLRA